MMKFAIILATILAVSAAFECRNYFQLNGRNVDGDGGYCNEGRPCTTATGYAMSHRNQYMSVDIRGCFSCDQATDQLGRSNEIMTAQLSKCVTCSHDFCNDDA